MELEGISTLTFYDGPAPVAFLQQKLNEIVTLNPWLDGRLVKSKEKDAKVRVRYPKVPTQHDPNIVTAMSGIGGAKLTLFTPEHVLLTEDDYKKHNYYDAFRKYCVKKANLSVNKNEPMFQVVVLKISEVKFGLFVSMSHVFADGHTYYKIYGMLSQSLPAAQTPATATATASSASAYNEPKAMITERKESALEKIDNMISFSVEFFKSAGFLCNVVGHVFFHKSPTLQKCLASPDYIKTAKEVHSATVAAASGTDATSPAFISTNDILTSAIFRAMKCDVGCMAVNFRGRIEGATDDHAGKKAPCCILLSLSLRQTL